MQYEHDDSWKWQYYCSHLHRLPRIFKPAAASARHAAHVITGPWTGPTCGSAPPAARSPVPRTWLPSTHSHAPASGLRVEKQIPLCQAYYAQLPERGVDGALARPPISTQRCQLAQSHSPQYSAQFPTPAPHLPAVEEPAAQGQLPAPSRQQHPPATLLQKAD